VYFVRGDWKKERRGAEYRRNIREVRVGKRLERISKPIERGHRVGRRRQLRRYLNTQRNAESAIAVSTVGAYGSAGCPGG
jgi:hypothetical protein